MLNTGLWIASAKSMNLVNREMAGRSNSTGTREDSAQSCLKRTRGSRIVGGAVIVKATVQSE